MSRLQDYDPTVIEVAARRLYEKATASLFGSIVLGASLGAAFGAVPLTPLGDAWPIPATFGPATMLIGAVCGAAIGYVIGDSRAFRHRLQAQAMLTDLQRELNTSATVDALNEIVNRLTEQFELDRREREARRAAYAPAPVPAAEPEPAPVPAAPEPQHQPQQAPTTVLLTVPMSSPEPEPAPHVFALPEPEPEPQLQPQPQPQPEPAFALPVEPVSFPPVEEPEPEPAPLDPPASDYFPPISADAR